MYLYGVIWNLQRGWSQRFPDIYTSGKGLSVPVSWDTFGRSCSKIEGRRDRKLHPMADQGTPMVASPGTICQLRIPNLNSDIHGTLLFFFLSLSSFYFTFFDLSVTVPREIGTSFWSTTRLARGTDVHTGTDTNVHIWTCIYVDTCVEGRVMYPTRSSRGMTWNSRSSPPTSAPSTPIHAILYLL